MGRLSNINMHRQMPHTQMSSHAAMSSRFFIIGMRHTRRRNTVTQHYSYQAAVSQQSMAPCLTMVRLCLRQNTESRHLPWLPNSLLPGMQALRLTKKPAVFLHGFQRWVTCSSRCRPVPTRLPRCSDNCKVRPQMHNPKPYLCAKIVVLKTAERSTIPG